MPFAIDRSTPPPENDEVDDDFPRPFFELDKMTFDRSGISEWVLMLRTDCISVCAILSTVVPASTRARAAAILRRSKLYE